MKTTAARVCGALCAAAAGLAPAGELESVSVEFEHPTLEEMLVTAEKREATVAETPLAITAFSESMIADLGIQSPDELVNYIPATTRDDYDIRIRGVGRNFRALGGDPGVATYYNGVYSEDFGIASTENALHDVARIEVLRGPQGTLYGRNSIGGALNYITNDPTRDWTGEVRAQVGGLATRETYGVLSGPLTDAAAFRVSASKRLRDGSLAGAFGTPDADSVNDQNVAVSFVLKPRADLSFKARVNDRRSYRDIDIDVVVNEGYGTFRGVRRTDVFAYGIVPVPAGTAGAQRFSDPRTGAVAWGAPPRPGVDAAPSMPAHAFGGDAYLSGPGDLRDAGRRVLTNGRNNEEFDHQAASFEALWQARDDLAVKYLFGYSDFAYTYDFDSDGSNGAVSQGVLTVLEDVYTHSHEVQALWDPDERLSVTAGLYAFFSSRLQDFTITNAAAQGRVTRAARYGFLDEPQAALGGATILQAAGIGPAVGLDEVPVGSVLAGRWEGEANGHLYRHRNRATTDQAAVFVQAAWDFDDDWAATLGIRWAEDDKWAYENRGGYFETDFLGGFAGFYPFLLPPALLAGQTDLSMTNILMGAAVPTGDPANPIAPTCPLDDAACPDPLRLTGVPLSWAGRGETSDRWGDVTWRANVDWTPADGTLVYLSATTGYRAGGYGLGIADARAGEAGSIAPLAYDAEHVLAYELGLKTTVLGGRAQLNAAAYRYDYEDYQDQINAYDPVQAQSRDIPTNTGDARNSGIEAEVAWLVTPALVVNGSYSYAATAYRDDFLVAVDDDPRLPAPLFGPVAVNINGNSLKRIPEHKAALWSGYGWTVRNGRMVARASLTHTGAFFSDQRETLREKVPSASRLDLSLTWFNTAETLRIQAFVDNVLDATNFRQVNVGNHNSFYRTTARMLYPRYAGVDVRWSLGN